MASPLHLIVGFEYEIHNVSLLVASAVNSEGFREIPGICEGAKPRKTSPDGRPFYAIWSIGVSRALS